MNYSQIANNLSSRVGFRQPLNPKQAPLHPDLIVSDSGLNVSGISEKYLSPDFISQCLVFFDGMNIADYDALASYSVGDQVKFDIGGFKQVFYSLEDENTGNPYTDSDYWESALSNLLRKYRENACKELIKEAIDLHNYSTYTKKLITASPIFAENTKGKFITPEGKFKGVRIKTADRQNLRMDVLKIGIKSDVSETFPFYLYHSSQPDALQVFNVTTEANRHVWRELIDTDGNKLSLSYLDEKVSAGGYYILGYFETSSQLYGYDFDDFTTCMQCARYNPNFILWDSYRSYYKITPVSLDPDGILIPELPEYISDKYINKIHFNLNINVTCDPTNIFLQSLHVFDVAYQKKLALLILKDMMYSERINKSSDNAKGNIHYLLYGEKSENNYVEGLESQYKKSLKQIILDFSDMDVACFSNNTMLREGRI